MARSTEEILDSIHSVSLGIFAFLEKIEKEMQDNKSGGSDADWDKAGKMVEELSKMDILKNDKSGGGSIAAIAMLMKSSKDLSKSDVENAKSFMNIFNKDLANNISAFAESVKGIKNTKIGDIAKVLNPIMGLITTMANISIWGSFKIRIGLNLIRKSVCKFLDELLTAIQDKNVKNMPIDLKKILEPIGNFMHALADVSFISLIKFKLIMPQIVKELSNFIQSLTKVDTRKLQLAGAVAAIVSLLDFFKDIDRKQRKKIKKALANLSKDLSKGLTKIFDAIGNVKINDNAPKIITALTGLLATLMQIGIFAAFKLKISCNTIAKVLNKFFKDISNIASSKENQNGVEDLTKLINAVVKLVAVLTITLIAMVIIGALAGEKTLIKAGAMMLLVVGIVYLILKISESIIKNHDEKEVGNLIALIGTVTKLIMVLSLTAIALVIIGALADWETLAKAGLMLITVVAVGMLVLYCTKKIVDDLGNNDLKSFIDIIKSVTMLIGTIGVLTIALVLVAKIAEWEDIFKAGVMLIAVVGVGLLVLYSTKKIVENMNGSDLKSLSDIIKSVTMLIGTIGVLTIALVLVAKIAEWEDIFKAGVMLSMVTIVTWILLDKIESIASSKADEKKMQRASNMIKLGIAVTAIIVILAIALAFAGKAVNIKDVALGAFSAAIVLAVLLVVLNRIEHFVNSKINEKKFKTAAKLIGTAVIVTTVIIILGIIMSLAAKSFTIKNVLTGGLATGIVLAVLYLVTEYLIKLDKEIKNKKIDYKKMAKLLGFAGLVIVAAIGVGVLMVKAYKDVSEKQAKLGTIVTVTVIAGLLTISKVLVEFDKSTKKYKINYGKLAQQLITAAVIIEAAALIGRLVIKTLGGISESEAKVGLATVTTIILGMIGLGYATKALSNVSVKDLVKGGLVIAAMGVLIALISIAFIPLFELFEQVKDITIEDVLLTEGIIISNLALFTGLSIGLGALMSCGPVLAWMAFGLVALAAIAGVIAVTSFAMMPMIELIIMLKGANITVDDVLKTDALIVATLAFFGALAIGIGALTMIPIIGPIIVAVLMTGCGIMAAQALVIMAVSEALLKFIDLIIAVNKIPGGEGAIDKATSVITDQMIPAIEGMAQVFGDMGDKLNLKKIRKTAEAVNEMMKPINKFVDMVCRIAAMTYIADYTEDGKPIYKPFKTETFKAAADVIAIGFTTFLSRLGSAVKKFDNESVEIVEKLGKALNPIMDVIHRYVEILQFMINGRIIEGYDNNGKPIYGERISMKDYATAAIVVSLGFGLFLTQLAKSLDSFSFKSVVVLKWISKNLKPVMDAVGQFVGILKTMIQGRFIEDWKVVGSGENAKVVPVYGRQITNGDYLLAALTISIAFGTFLSALGKGLEKISPKSLYVLKLIQDNIKPVMEGVSLFVDSVLKLLQFKYIEDWKTVGSGENAKVVPVYSDKKLTKEDFSNASDMLCEVVGDFIVKLYNKLEKVKPLAGAIVNTFADTLPKVMQSVGLFADAVLKLANCTPILSVTTDDKGNQTILYGQPLGEDVWKVKVPQAATTITNSMCAFMEGLVKGANELGGFWSSNKDELNCLTENLIKLFGEKGPITIFADSVIKLASGVIQKVDAQGKPTGDYINFSINDCITAADTITDCMVAFMTGLAKASDIGDEDEIKALGDNLSKITKTISPFIESLEPYLADTKKLNNLNTAATIVTNTLVSFTKKVAEWADQLDEDNLTKSGKYIPIATEINGKLLAFYKSANSVIDESNDVTAAKIKASLIDPLFKFVSEMSAISKYEDDIETALDIMKLVISGEPTSVSGTIFGAFKKAIGSSKDNESLMGAVSSYVRLISSINSQIENFDTLEISNKIINSINAYKNINIKALKSSKDIAKNLLILIPGIKAYSKTISDITKEYKKVFDTTQTPLSITKAICDSVNQFKNVDKDALKTSKDITKNLSILIPGIKAYSKTIAAIAKEYESIFGKSTSSSQIPVLIAKGICDSMKQYSQAEMPKNAKMFTIAILGIIKQSAKFVKSNKELNAQVVKTSNNTVKLYTNIKTIHTYLKNTEKERIKMMDEMNERLGEMVEQYKELTKHMNNANAAQKEKNKLTNEAIDNEKKLAAAKKETAKANKSLEDSKQNNASTSKNNTTANNTSNKANTSRNSSNNSPITSGDFQITLRKDANGGYRGTISR